MKSEASESITPVVKLPVIGGRLPVIISFAGFLASVSLSTAGLWISLSPLAMSIMFALSILLTLGGACLLFCFKSWEKRYVVFLILSSVSLVAYFLIRMFLVEPEVVFYRAVAGSDRGSLKAASAKILKRLRVVDLNVLHGYPDFIRHEVRYRNTLRALRALNPDILILQEVWWTRAYGHLARRLFQDLKMTDCAYVKANGSLELMGFEEGSAVLSRYPISLANRLLLKPAKTWFEKRIALLVEIEVGGRTLRIVGTHLANNAGNIADAQASFLAEKLSLSGGDFPQNQMLIVAGDFNRISDAPAVKEFTLRGFRDLVPGGIDHFLVSTGQDTPWTVERSELTLRSEDFPAFTGKVEMQSSGKQVSAAAFSTSNHTNKSNFIEISDHPGIVVDFLFHGK